MLVVVAIIGILVAVVFPTFGDMREKAARAVDIANARAIKAMLSVMIMDGDVSFPKRDATNKSGNGIYVVVCKNGDSAPAGYRAGQGGQNLKIGESSVYCGADKDVVINGEISQDWNKKIATLDQAVSACFSENGMKSYSNSKVVLNNIGGWDWYIVQCNWSESNQNLEWRIFSGLSNQNSGFSEVEANSNIERYMNHARSVKG